MAKLYISEGGKEAVYELFDDSPEVTVGRGASNAINGTSGRDVILGRMTVCEFVAFNAYLGMLSVPMIAFGWVTNLLQRGMASWKRMFEVLDEHPAIDDRAAGAWDRTAEPRIRGST